MARSKLFEQIRQCLSVAREADQRKTDVREIIAERQNLSASRRELLKGAALVIGAMTIPKSIAAFSGNTPRIAVIGGGLSGLTCAYRLKQAGISATVYEAANRTGGRCWTLRDYFDDGQIAEHGGELIDNNHIAIKHLVQELRLDLDNLLQGETNGTEPIYYFDGVPYTFEQATDDIKGVWQKIHKDVSQASYPTLYNSYTQRGWELDHLSIIEWINESVPGGISSRLGKLLDVAYNIEYGGESAEQSSLNLLYLLGYKGQGQLRLFGPSNEKFHVRGGNDQIAARITENLGNQIKLNHELKAAKLNSNGTYTLTFKNGGRNISVTADKVVMTVPFSILRSSVDLSQSGFSPLKMTAIHELGMGTNSKLQLQFTDRHWDSLGNNGDTYADTGYQATWHVTRAQNGNSGILVDYTGGDIGNSFTRTANFHANRFLLQIEPVLPGISAKWNGKAWLDYWADYQWTRGSYSYWKVGQYTKFVGIEREREGNCHFAGEHTSIDFQGYLNGAVETGERAASEILSDLR